MLNVATRREYDRQRKLGNNAHVALSYARTREAWDWLEHAGLVKFEIIPDESPDLSYLGQEMPKHVREREYDRASRDGVWGIATSFRTSPDGDWIRADSVFGFVGDDWEDSGYDWDVKAECIAELRKALKNRCPLCRQSRQSRHVA